MNRADFIKSEQACAAEKAAAYPFIWRQLAALGWQSCAGKVPGEKIGTGGECCRRKPGPVGRPPVGSGGEASKK